MMKRLKPVAAAIAAMTILSGSIPAMAAPAVTITPKIVIASSALNANTEGEGDYSYQWLWAPTEEGPYEPIYKATDSKYIFSTNDKNKYIKVEVTNEQTGETAMSEDTRNASSLGPVSVVKMPLAAAKTPDENVFFVDNQPFVLLDEFLDERSAYYVTADDSYGKRVFDENGYARFDPYTEGNIGYFLNQDFLLEGNTDEFGTYRLPQSIIEGMDTEHIWWTEAGAKDGDCPEDYSVQCGVNLMSMSEAVKYQEKFGYETAGGSGAWWLRSQRGRNGTEDNIFAMNGPDMEDMACTAEENGIRPAFYLNYDFFISTKIDPGTAGEAVKRIITERYTKEQLSELYTMDELMVLGFHAEEGTVISPAAVTADSPNIGAEVTLTASMNVAGAAYYQYQWLERTDETEPYTEIKTAKSQTYYITTMDKNRYLTCRVIPVFADGTEGESQTAEESVYVENLGMVSEKMFSTDVRTQTMVTPEANKFSLEGSDREYILLDHFNDQDAEFYIMADYETGVVEADAQDPGFIDPDKKDNIGYWLNNHYTELGYEIAGIHKDPIEKAFLDYVDKDHEWWCEAGIAGNGTDGEDYSFNAGFSMLSHSEAIKYQGVYGWASKTEHGGWTLHWWTRTSSDTANKFFYMQNGAQVNDATGNMYAKDVTPGGGHEEISPRPVFYLNHDFFLNVRPAKIGENVKKAIKSSYTINELLESNAGYTMNTLKALGLIDIPQAENLAISGTPMVNGVLTGSYQYFHEGQKEESGTVCGFEVYDSEKKEYQTLSSGNTCTVTQAQLNQLIRFYAEPCDSDGVKGERVYTEPVYINGTAKVIALSAGIVSETGGKVSALSRVSGIKPSLVLKNVTNEPQKVTVMIWLYNKSDRAVTNRALTIELAANAQKTITEPQLPVLDYKEGNYARLFVVDGLDSMVSVLGRPLEVK